MDTRTTNRSGFARIVEARSNSSKVRPVSRRFAAIALKVSGEGKKLIL
jgi:hypothetical protein